MPLVLMTPLSGSGHSRFKPHRLRDAGRMIVPYSLIGCASIGIRNAANRYLRLDCPAIAFRSLSMSLATAFSVSASICR